MYEAGEPTVAQIAAEFGVPVPPSTATSTDSTDSTDSTNSTSGADRY
jgi:hypothetical protein